MYCDTSLIVALLTRERHTDTALAWLKRHTTGLTISDWVHVEVAGALARKVRLGELEPNLATLRREQWRRLAETQFSYVGIGRSDFASAAAMIGRPDTGLRAGDALHLALAQANGLQTATLDDGMAKAAAMLNLPCELVSA